MSDRKTEPKRGFTPARIIALIFIALGVLGLVYLRLAGGTSAVSVPAGARAGQLKLTPAAAAAGHSGVTHPIIEMPGVDGPMIAYERLPRRQEMCSDPR